MIGVRQAVLSTSLWLTACSPATLPENMDALCDRTAPVKGNAGCLIISGDQLLVIKQRASGKWSIPGGTQDGGESASCTAWRETWEETGISVSVADHVGTWINGFHLYQCDIPAPDIKDSYVPPSSWYGAGEVSEIRWKSLNDISPEHWRYPEQLPWIKKILAK